jgi:serine phosphatase RsbU (regulator of sigma subunit)/ligand-binding sensor domain-containing protein
MFRRFHTYLLLPLLLYCFTLGAQNELGNPYIKNFNSKKHNFTATVWDITQDNKGLMYFGAANGVRQFDGTSWRNIQLSNESTVRSMDVDENGRVYVGGKGEFGYLGEDSLGYPIYISLSEKLDEEVKDFTDVWNIYVTKEGVFFLSFKRIFKWADDKLTAYDYDDITAHLGFYANDKLFLVRDKAGLSYYKDNDFVPVPGGMHYEDLTIFSILPFDDDHVLVASRRHGLELLNYKTGEIIPFENKVNDDLLRARIYHATVSENGEYVIGTLNNGIYVIDKSGHLITHLTIQNGLQSNNIKYLFKDHYGAIWAGTAMGLSYIDLNLPLTSFDMENGINGYCRDLVRFKDEIYIATGNSVFYLDKEELNPKKKFKPISNANGQFWAFLVVGDKLLVGSDRLYELRDKKLIQIKSFDRAAVFNLFHSEKNPNFVYLAMKTGLAIAEIQDNGDVKVIHRYDDFKIELHHLNEDSEGNLWASTAFNFTVKIDHTSFNKEKGFPLSYKKYETEEKLGTEQIIKYDNELLFSSSEGLLSINENDTFEVSNKIQFENWSDEYIIREMSQDGEGNLWIHYHQAKKSGILLAEKIGKHAYRIKTDPFTRINEKVSHSKAPYVEDNGVAWFVGGDGLVRYDLRMDKTKRKNYQVNIRSVALNTDSIIDYGSTLSNNLFEFIFKNNATSFTFSAATFSNEDEVYYQYFLEGHDEEWSEWTTHNTKEYNFLHESDYTFRVRAKNVYNQISEEDNFSFTILPPWYRTIWAYVIYALLFLMVIFIIIKVATYRLQKSKKQLEIIVEERTKDIVKEKEIVEEQKLLIEEVHGELSERNKDVMDSIKYAQRIQSSILPPLSRLEEEFKDAFILYKPRDIVSGDFYWYEKVGDFFIMACADCTGHGVPGAFMSMIGTTLLNKIVEKDEVTSCEKALTELDMELQKTLQQTLSAEKEIVMDGMDISLIAVNTKGMEFHYSGAYRPLYMIRDNEVIVHDSNRCSIGGGFNKEKVFEGKSISIQSGDQFYMFTDGVTDQFGGEKNKKFKRERLKKLLISISEKPMTTQKEEINKAFEDWRGDNEQIDDVLMMGIKIP